MGDAYGLGPGQIGLLTASFVLPAALFGFPVGVLADRRGPRAVVVGGFLVMGLGGLGIAASPAFPVVLALRAVQGLGFAVLQPVSLGILAEVLDGASQATAQVRRLVVMAAAELVLPVAGGALGMVDWRWAFATSGVCFPMTLLAAKGLAGLRGRPATAGYWSALGSASRSPRLVNLQLVGFLYFFLKYGYIAYAATLLVDERGATSSQAGLMIGGVGLASVTATAAFPTYSRWVGDGALVAFGFAVSGLGLVVTLVPAPLAVAALGGVVFGAGNAVVGTAQTTLVPVVVRPRVRFGFVALNGATRNLGKASAPLAGAALAAVGGVGAVFASLAGAALAALPTARWLPRPWSRGGTGDEGRGR